MKLFSCSAGHQSSNGAKQSSSGALGFALSAVDKMAGRKAREELESKVDHIAQSKFLGVFFSSLKKLLLIINL